MTTRLDYKYYRLRLLSHGPGVGVLRLPSLGRVVDRRMSAPTCLLGNGNKKKASERGTYLAHQHVHHQVASKTL